MLSKSLFSSTKKLYKPVVLQLNSTFCYINGFLMNISLKLKVNSILILKKFSNLKKKRFNSNQSFILLINKKFINTFFSFLFQSLDGISHGFKITLYIKGKGLRIQLKTRKNKLCIYFKLGYSHKIFLHLPSNCWAKIFGRRRTMSFFSTNYIVLRNLVLRVRKFYPIGLYKIRGFYLENEKIKITQGKSRLGSSFSGYYG